MQGEPRQSVTVIMPAFNSDHHISDAINSVLHQSYPHFELLIVDGGSSDSTREIVQAYAVTDTRVGLIDNANDRGPAHARSVGIRNSTSRYVAFLDADDYWLPNKLEEQVRFMADRGEQFSYSYYRPISDDGSRIGCVVPMRTSYDFRGALRHRGIGTLTVMVRRELLTDDVISVWKRAGGEELLWWLLILRKGVVARLLPSDLARYRNTAGSLSKNQIYTLKSVWRMYRNDIGLGPLEAASHYASYIVDSAIRKIRLKMCSMLAGNTNGGVD